MFAEVFVFKAEADSYSYEAHEPGVKGFRGQRYRVPVEDGSSLLSHPSLPPSSPVWTHPWSLPGASHRIAQYGVEELYHELYKPLQAAREAGMTDQDTGFGSFAFRGRRLLRER